MKPLTIVKTLAKTLADPVFWRLSRRELESLLRKFPSGRGSHVVPITRAYRGYGWYKRLGAFQVDDEFCRLADWALERQPSVIVEIGTSQGATLLLWARIAQKLVVSIDLPGGIHGGGYAIQKTKLFKHFVVDRPGVHIDLVRASSQEVTTKQRVAHILNGSRIDILFIDGDHRLESVTRDFELWRDLVRPGGSIVFHDILPHVGIPSCQVDALWQTLKEQYPGQTREIVSSANQGWAGIGILSV